MHKAAFWQDLVKFRYSEKAKIFEKKIYIWNYLVTSKQLVDCFKILWSSCNIWALCTVRIYILFCIYLHWESWCKMFCYFELDKIISKCIVLQLQWCRTLPVIAYQSAAATLTFFLYALWSLCFWKSPSLYQICGYEGIRCPWFEILFQGIYGWSSVPTCIFGCWEHFSFLHQPLN